MEPEERAPWRVGTRGVALAPAPIAPVVQSLPVPRVEAPRPAAAAGDDAPASSAELTARRIYLALTVVELLVGLRAALKLLGANPDAGFSRLLDALSTPLVLPFRGVFPDVGGRHSVVEGASLLALAIYAIIAWAAVRVLMVVRGQGPASRG